MQKKTWYQSKAIWTCLGAIGYAITLRISGEITTVQLMTALFATFEAMFIRNAL